MAVTSVIACSAERASEHPLARAITGYADAIGLAASYLAIRDGTFDPVSGKGLSCRVIATAAVIPRPVGSSTSSSSGIDAGDGIVSASSGSGGDDGDGNDKGGDVLVAVGSPSYIRAHVAAAAGAAATAIPAAAQAPFAAAGSSISTATGSSDGATSTGDKVGCCGSGSADGDTSNAGSERNGFGAFSEFIEELVAGLEGGGKTAVCAAVNGEVVAVMGISDAIRPEAPDVSHWVCCRGRRLPSAVCVATARALRPVAAAAVRSLPRARALSALRPHARAPPLP
jgi:hypothetical protein